MAGKLLSRRHIADKQRPIAQREVHAAEISPFDLDSGASAREARQRSTMGKKNW